MPKPKVTYFDMAGSRGEECRLALAVAGVDFEDNRIKYADWQALKPKTPFGLLPVFEEEGKPPLSQSNAILSYIGRRYGLLPDDPWEAARLDSLMDAAEDLRHAVARTFGIDDADELKRKREALAEGPIKAWGASLEKQIAGPFAGGERISVADIKIYVVATWFAKGVLDHVPADVLAPFEKLTTLVESVKGHPKVVEWYRR